MLRDTAKFVCLHGAIVDVLSVGKYLGQRHYYCRLVHLTSACWLRSLSPHHGLSVIRASCLFEIFRVIAVPFNRL